MGIAIRRALRLTNLILPMSGPDDIPLSGFAQVTRHVVAQENSLLLCLGIVSYRGRR